ncbi:MAG TPA: LemA family protein [Cytophagaceae bacterium]
MKRNFLNLIILLSVVFSLSSCGYNTMVDLEVEVESKWAQVENQYQRRADLIPNIVNTVKGEANFEKEVLTSVIEARASATQVKIDANNLTPDKIEQFEAAQNNLSSALSRLLMTVESYPQLKANAAFADLRAQLEGTENRIAVARMDFNEAVSAYNKTIKRFPNNLFAGMFGFESKGFFKAKPGADTTPEVKFE